MDQQPVNVSNRTRPTTGPHSALQIHLQKHSDNNLLYPPEGYAYKKKCIEITDTEDECPICLCKIERPDCISCINGHRMHYSCYVKMFNKNMANVNVNNEPKPLPTSCPICRNKEFKYCSPTPERKSVERKSVKLTSNTGKRYRSAMTNSSPSGGKRRKSSRPRKIQSGNVSRRTIKHRNKRM